jgi:hypothetical protein
MILSIHIWYQYIENNSLKKPWKWGTFVEAVFQDISYIPYLWDTNQDSYYQSFFFDRCVVTQVSWSKINYNDSLCKVNTVDFKTFTVIPNLEKKRSDGTPLTIDDVEWTYSSLLINNIWNINRFNTYTSIDIQRKWDKLILTFPTSSYDNFVFFTNFILPKHILNKEDLNYYKTTFVKNAVVSQCAYIEPSTTDEKSLLINTKKCDNVYFNYYQVKKFDNAQELQKYVWQGNANTIDLYIDPLAISWYLSHKFLNSTYPTLFFNIKSEHLTQNNRIYLAYLLHNTLFETQNIIYMPLAWSVASSSGSTTWASAISSSTTSTGEKILTTWTVQKEIDDQEPYLWLTKIIQNDRFLFDYFPKTPWLQYNKNITTSAPKSSTTPIPTSIYIEGNWKNKYYQVNEIKDRIELNMRFDVAYQKVGITANNGAEYIPESYQVTGKKLQYNIAPKYGNIKPWYNTYIVRWYSSGNIPFKIATITITYNNSSVVTTKQKIKFIYEPDVINNIIVEHIQKIITANNLDDQFEFVWTTGPDMLDQIIQTREYDIVLKNLDLWTKKDISWLFSVDNAIINPSLYQNSELSSYIQQYFIASKKIKTIVKQGIDDIYNKDIPLLIIWKQYQHLWTKNNIQIQTSDRLYDSTARKDFLSTIYFADQLDPQRWEIFKLGNIWKFITESLYR